MRPAPAFGSARWVAWMLTRDYKLHREHPLHRAYPTHCPVTGIRYSRAEREFHVLSEAGLICRDCTDPAVASLVVTRAPLCARSLPAYLGSMR